MTRKFGLLHTTKKPQDEIEREVLELWNKEDLFRKSLAAAEGRPKWVFFEGPPTANGRPGIHHVFSRTVKDLFCRHRAMSGYYVARKAGWDTHGLPVEIEVEKQLGISGKQQIEEIGTEKFNKMCRESVWKYRGDWEKLSERIGFWLDYDNPYVTYDNDYVESVWWALKTLYDKELLYRGHKILPYCARCGTALSSHEVAQGYRDVKDPSVYIALELVGGDGRRETGDGEVKRRIIVWTTTPWTLVSNVALAVHPDLEYIELKPRDDESKEQSSPVSHLPSPSNIILASSRTSAVLGEDYTDRWELIRTLKGSDLVGLRYKRPLDWVEYGEGNREVIVGELFVSADDGSGVVHMAPAFGADDYAAGQRHGLAFLQPVNARGEFPTDIPLVGGKFVKDADKDIVRELKRRGVLWSSTQFEHSYPHCWRCDTPLLYFARSSWFIRTTKFRDAMLARNARVDWHPSEVGEGRFGEWLKNNIDWAISRDRYWGTPLPLWVCDADDSHVQAIGSYADLEKYTGKTLSKEFDPHKPYIDAYTWPCDKCKGISGDSLPRRNEREAGKESPLIPGDSAGTMRRVPEVIDTWFDSGSMPFAQWHYPFENKDKLAQSYPADFIAEGVDQTRGWFYSLLAIAAGLGDALPNNTLAHEKTGGPDAAPYKTVVVNDLVLDKDGQKMSKSKGNVVDPWSVIPEHGVDAVRLFLISSSQVWLPRRFDVAAIRDTVGGFLLTFKNVYSGIFAEYANFGWEPSSKDPVPESRPLIDRWILSRMANVEREVNELLLKYEATIAVRMVMDFVVDDVSNWYVRLNRARFYDVDTDDSRAAFATLHEVLMVTCRLLAPFAPFITDWVHRELVGESVHVQRFTREQAYAQTYATDASLEQAMSHVRKLAALGRAAREDAGIKVRQPLAEMVCVVPNSGAVTADGEFTKLIPLLKTELNVKDIRFISSSGGLVTLEAKANFRTLGKKFGKDTPLAAQAVAALSSDALVAFEKGETLAVAVGNQSRELDAEDLTIIRKASGDLVVKEEAGYFAAVNPVITPELRNEGLARELISKIQRMRKEEGFAVSDRIALSLRGDAEMEEAVRAHQRWIAEEVLAKSITIGNGSVNNVMRAVDLDGLTAHVALQKVG